MLDAYQAQEIDRLLDLVHDDAVFGEAAAAGHARLGHVPWSPRSSRLRFAVHRLVSRTAIANRKQALLGRGRFPIGTMKERFRASTPESP